MDLDQVEILYILKIKDLGQENLSGSDITNYVVGMLVAAVVGYICIKTMLKVVRQKKYKYTLKVFEDSKEAFFKKFLWQVQGQSP